MDCGWDLWDQGGRLGKDEDLKNQRCRERDGMSVRRGAPKKCFSDTLHTTRSLVRDETSPMSQSRGQGGQHMSGCGTADVIPRGKWVSITLTRAQEVEDFGNQRRERDQTKILPPWRNGTVHPRAGEKQGKGSH